MPDGGGDRGDPPADADGSGRCYLTDNVDGNSDVDNGSTILTSPILDASAGGDIQISYWRWYSNVFGDAPRQDIFVVEISDDGGSTWTNLETVGPSGNEVEGGWFKKSFRVADFVTPNNQLRLRFIASDTDPQSVVEAGVDGVQLVSVECGQPADLVDFEIVTGTLISGDLDDLRHSDNQRLRVRSGHGSQLSELHKMEIIVNAVTAVDNPTSLGVTVEGRLDEPGGQARIALRNWNTNAFEQVGTFPIGTTEVSNSIGGLDATRYVSGQGDIDASVKTLVFVPFLAFNFDTFLDQVGVIVD